MSWQALRWVGSLPKYKRLSTADWLVLTWLASHHHQHTGRTDPSEELLAHETHLSPRTVGRAKKRLAREGLIEIEPQYKGRGRGRKSDQMNLLGTDPETGTRLATFHDLDEPGSGSSDDLGEQVTGRNDLPDNHDGPGRTAVRRTQRTQTAAAEEVGAVKKEVEVVFASWSASLDSDVTHLLTDARASVIAAALEWATVEECCEAVAAWPHSDFHSGRTARNGKPQNRLDQLLKDREVVEELLDKKAHRNTSSRNRFLEDEEEDT